MTTKLTIKTFPNEAAAAYIRGKAVADRANFGKLPDQLKQRAFAVAGIEKLDVLRKLRDTVAKLPEGANWDEVKKDLAAQISPYLKTGDAKADMTAARRCADFTLRTQGFQAYAVARHQEQTSVAKSFPYWQYQTVGDSRVRAGHAALDGKVLRADDPWWKTHYPPWDWGCRCIVIALDEEDAEEIGITEHKDMPTPGRSGSWSFDPSDAGVSLDSLVQNRDEADCRLLADSARNVTVHRDDGSECTMWDYMIDRHMTSKGLDLIRQTDRDGNERAIVLDFVTGKQIGKVSVGTPAGVDPEIPEGKAVCMLHTHPNGDNTPSPADMLFGFNAGSRAEYVAAGKRIRRWVWLRTPEPEDARLMVEFGRANKNGGVDVVEYNAFLRRLAQTGYIRMEELS